MKNILGRTKAAAGNTLVVTLIICSILSVSIFGYLSVIEQQAKLSGRSQSWNIAIAIVEAGIEEALEHLNTNYKNMATDGWVASGALYSRSNSLADGSKYVSVIDMTSSWAPTVTCQAYVGAANMVAKNSSPFFYAAIPATPNPTVISRKVRVTCYRGSLFLAALAAKHQIDMNGNSVTTDSFDSTDPNYSTFGVYDPSPWKVKDNGDVASNDTIINSINAGNANIYGHAATGPGGTIALGPKGGVGTHTWQQSNHGFQPGYITHNANFMFPDTTIQSTSGATPSSGMVTESYDVIATNNVTQTNAPTYSPWGGIQSNILSTSVSSALPNPIPPGMTTNVTYATVTDYNSVPKSGPVETNILNWVITKDWSKVPAGVPVTTNQTGSTLTSTTYPNPPPPNLQTNTVYVKDHVGEPAPGTYVGILTVNGVNYSYYQITGYSWPELSYKFPVYGYKYPVYSYNINTFSYNYNVYQTNTFWTTNYYDYVLETGSYYLPSFTGKKMYVKGNAKLVVGGEFKMSGSDVFKVDKAGSLTAWVDGTAASIGGNGVVNKSGKAINCTFYFSPNVKNLNFDGNGEFTGILVAPEADCALNGGGKAYNDFVGCLMINSVRLNGTFSFHYDEALGKQDGTGRFLIKSWDEIAATP